MEYLKMHIPQKETVVLIVDDIPEEVQGMISVLKKWPKIRVFSIIQSRSQKLDVPHYADILLLDENMDGIKGTEVAHELLDSGFKGIIASITSASRPSYTPWHFSKKYFVSSDPEIANEFIDFMNGLLEKSDSR